MSFQEFQKTSRNLTPQDWRFLFLAGFALVALLVLLAFANLSLARILPDGGEFYLLRVGGRAFLFDRIEPYSASVPAAVQEQVYGRTARAGEELYILDIPFHLMPVFFPLALFPDAMMARAFWMALAELALLAFLLLSFRLLERQPSRLFAGLALLLCFPSYYAWQAFLEGSPSILLGLAYVGILLALRAQLDELAGALLASTAFQWEMGGPFLLFILLSVFWARRWRVLGGAGMLLFILLIASFLLYPGWLLPFLRASWNNLRADFGFSTREIFGYLWPGHGNTLAWTLTGILAISLGYEWGRSRGANFQRFTWTAALTLASAPLLGFRSEPDNLVPLLFPAILFLVTARERWKRIGDGLAVTLLVVMTGLPWLFHLRVLPALRLPTPEILYLFLPLFTLLGLYWMRWWMIRPPRTWLDHVSNMESR
ncbi:MAG: glycosyltransferase 87 family protein [Chloroflexota bacterium]